MRSIRLSVLATCSPTSHQPSRVSVEQLRTSPAGPSTQPNVHLKPLRRRPDGGDRAAHRCGGDAGLTAQARWPQARLRYRARHDCRCGVGGHRGAPRDGIGMRLAVQCRAMRSSRHTPTDDRSGATSSSARRSAVTASHAATRPAATINPPPNKYPDRIDTSDPVPISTPNNAGPTTQGYRSRSCDASPPLKGLGDSPCLPLLPYCPTERTETLHGHVPGRD